MTEDNKYLELAGGAPYHDDFDPRDNFMRIMFNPSRAVQARELTQLQTILQNQQKVASDFLFKDNSLVDGARISINRSKPAFLASNTDLDGSTVLPTIDSTWIGETLVNVEPGLENPPPVSKQITITHVDDTIGSRVAVYYEYSGDKPEIDEEFWTPVGDKVVVDDIFTAIVANCDEGIVYSKEHFIHIPAQEIVVTNNNEFQTDDQEGRIFIGYRIQEDIVTDENQEVIATEGEETITLGEKLKDPASGSRNFNAPGAHRYRIKADLSAYFELLDVDGTTITHQLTLQDVRQDYTDEELNGDPSLTEPVQPSDFPVGRPVGETFLDEFETFIVVDNQTITRDQTEPQLGAIEDILARRTFAESGNYTVDDFTISVEPDPTDSESLLVTIGPGKAFVHGYEITKSNSTKFKIPRARQTPLRVLQGARKTFHRLTSFTIDSKTGSTVAPDGTIDDSNSGFAFGSGDTVQFTNQVNGLGDVIAEGRIHSVERDDTTLVVYFSSIGKLMDSLTSLKSFTTTYELWSANVDYQLNDIVRHNGGVWKATTEPAIGDEPGVSGNWTETVPTSMNVSLRSLTNGRQTIPYTSGTTLPLITRIDQVDVPEYISNVKWSVSRRQTVTATTGGSGSTGLQISLSPSSDGTFQSVRPVSLIYNQTKGLYLDPVEHLDTITTISEGSTATIDLINASTSEVEAGDELVVDFLMDRKNDPEDTNTFARTKTLELVEDEVHTIPAGDNIIDTLELLNEDVYEIVSIVQTTNVLPSLADNYNPDSAYDVTFGIPEGSGYDDDRPNDPYRTFTHDDLIKLKFNDGQTDEYYDRGKLSGFKRFWSKYKNTEASNNDWSGGVGEATEYKITYHYFRHDNSNNAAFTVNSYANASSLNRNFQTNKHLIPSYESKQFGRIDLIGCIDFRRKKSELVNGTNESPQDKVIPGSLIDFDIQYNYGRFDTISLDKNGQFVHRQGIPSQSPSAPSRPDNSMAMFNLYIPPYTFAANDVEIESFKNTRYTMKDIGRLESRIERLEDSVSLNLLEKAAFDMKISDSDGNDKFKSGIFVDNFEGLSHTNSNDPEFYIAVDRLEKVIHCPVKKANVPMKISPAADGLNNFETGDFQTSDTKLKQYRNTVTIAPTGERVVAENKTATGFMNLNPYLFYTWVGDVELTPAVDTWHEERYLPTRNVVTGSFEPPEGYNPDWVIDDIDTEWIGIDPSPAPNPPPTNPPKPSNPPSAPSGSTKWGTMALVTVPHLLASVSSVLADPTSSQSAIDREIERASRLASKADDITGDGLQWLEDSLMGEGRFGGEIGGTLEERRAAITRLMQELEFEGSVPTSANLGSNKIASGSRAHLLANRLGEEEFNKTSDTFHEASTGKAPVDRTMPIDGGMSFDADFSEPSNSSEKSSGSRKSGGEQHTTITKVKDVLKKNVEKVSDERVVDITSIYWMRPRLVKFNASGLRPGMRVFAALDNKQVSIKPHTDYIDDNGTYRVNGDGDIEGWFRIPPKTFTTGQKNFLLMDAEATSQAITEYESSGTLTTRQKTITSIRSVSVKQIRKTTTEIETLPEPDPPEIQPTPPSESNSSPTIDRPKLLQQGGSKSNPHYNDPVAQSFLITAEGGCILKGIDLFFATKSGDFSDIDSLDQNLQDSLNDLFPGHPKDAPQKAKSFFSGESTTDQTLRAPVSIYLVQMRDGAPTQNIVPMSHVTLPASAVNRDPDNPKDGRTEFKFHDPVYLEEGEEYAVVVASSSKEYNVWVTTLGEQNLFDGGRDAPGSAVASQPYLGSIFKSQNSFTWTPDQSTTLTFVLKRYSYPTTGEVEAYIVDSKFSEISDDVSNNQLTNPKPLYLDLSDATDNDKFDGDVDQVMTRVSNIYPMIGAMNLPDTEIAWTQAFSSNTSSFNWIPMQNNKRNKLLSSSAEDGSNEYRIDVSNNYIIRGQLKTSNQNVSPILDLEQMRAIAVRNQVIGIEGFFNIPTAGVDFQTGTAYNKLDLLRDPNSATDPEAPFYFVASNSGIGASEFATFTEALNSGKLKVLEQEINLPDSNGVTKGNAGTYISNTVNLKDGADDLRLILEASEPGQSYVKPYYRLLDQTNRYVLKEEDTDYSNNVNGLTSSLIYARPDTTANPQVIEVTHKHPIDGNRNSVQINGLNESGERIYFTGLSHENAFTINDGATSPTIIIATHSKVLNDRVEQAMSDGSGTIPFWVADSYDANAVVYYNNAFWYADGYIAPEYDPGTTYAEGDRVRFGGTGWVANASVTGEDPDTSSSWDEVFDLPYFPTGAKPSDGGQAWQKIPSAIIQGASDTDPSPGIKNEAEENAVWRPMVLRGSKLENNEFSDGQFHESEWVPRSNPGVDFRNFQIKLELIARDSKVNIPKCRNIRVVATI